MGLVATWLNGIGLSHAIPSFQAAGIVTPQALAELELGHYEALGVTEADDRRKLFYLVQRIKMAQDRDEEAPEVSNQQQVDNVLSKTLVTRKNPMEILDDDETEQVVEARKTIPEKKTVSSKESVSKENRRPAAKPSPPAASNTRETSAAAGTRPGRRTRATGSSTEKKQTTKRKIFMEDDDLEEDDPDDSDWDGEEEDSEMSAADEASSRSTTQRRVSSRLREKQERRQSDLSLQHPSREEDDDSSVTSVSSRRSTRSRSSVGSQSSSGVPRPKRQSTGSAASARIRRSSLSRRNESSGDESSSSSGAKSRTSAMPQPRPRRFESKIHNPGASKRTGKQLSTIPADSIAPMSPLVSLPVSRMDAEVRKQQEREERQAPSSSHATRQRSSSLDRTSSSGSDSELSKGRQHKSLSSSDSEKPNRRRSSDRKSLGSVSTSLPRTSSGSSRSRRSLGGSTRPDMSSLQRPNSLRDIRAARSSEHAERAGRRSLPASSGKATRESDLPSKGPLFVHGMPADDSWATQVSQLRANNNAEHELFAGHRLSDGDEEMRIRVIVRKRPMSTSETVSGKEVDVIHPLDHDSYGRILVYQPKTRVDLTKEIETVPFAFDNVFDEGANNAQIYERAVRNLIPGVFEGRWASVFAYGQTGSGKTFTMMGSNLTGINAGNATENYDNLGLYYMAAQDVFDLVKEPSYSHLSVGVSLFEIYGGKLFDLLNERKAVKCLENHRGKVCFPGLSEHPVESARDLMEVIEAGATNRSTGTTSKNADSSRSHAVLQLSLRKTIGKTQNIEHGRLTFIDLAGSERGADTSKASRTTRLEGAEINTSLLALKEVIRALATGDSMAHIPFRGSKLTQVLKESFVGENNSSVMVACVAPNISNCEHTLNTLRYADRVKERDSEKGDLPEGFSQGKHDMSRRLSRSTSAPVGLTVPPKPTVSDCEDEDALFSPADRDFVDDHTDLGSRGRSAPFSDDASADSALLDDLLDSENHSVQNPRPTSTVETSSWDNQEARKRAAQILISTHRGVMSELLGMVKHEMALVNKADGDRDTIDTYMDELGGLQKRQRSLVGELKEGLAAFNKVRGGGSLPTLSPAKPVKVLELLSDDDSFEDLRD